MADLNIGYNFLILQCIMVLCDRWEYLLFIRGHWQSPCTAPTAGKCLTLGLCKGTVKESFPARHPKHNQLDSSPLSAAALHPIKYAHRFVVLCFVLVMSLFLRHKPSMSIHSISHEICTQFCCVLFCCGYVIVFWTQALHQHSATITVRPIKYAHNFVVLCCGY